MVHIMIERVLEANIVKKDWRKVKLKFALVYPNIYKVGMSSFTTQLLYFFLNSRDDVLCERFFLPSDYSAVPESLESGFPLRDFDIVGFTLQFETDYVYVVHILERSGIPIYSKDRSDKDPLIIAGGPCAWENPEPIRDFIDLFVIGDGEAVLNRIIDLCLELKNPRKNLEAFAEIEGVYVPSLGRHPVKRALFKKLDDAFHPIIEIVPQIDEKSIHAPVFGKAYFLEVSRGCNRGCRFCLIGFQNRPLRIRSLEKLQYLVDNGPMLTGVSKVVLIGSNVTDYPEFEDFIWYIVNKDLELSVESLRVDGYTESIARALVKGGQKTVTFAPEAGTYRLRCIVNKRFTDDQILNAAKISRDCGLRRIKLYFIVGLPRETYEDLQGIVTLSQKLIKVGYLPGDIHISITPFIPKPHTPFQWTSQLPLSELRKRIHFVAKGLKKIGITYVTYYNPAWAKIQAALSLGDSSLSKLIAYVADYGNSLGVWRRAQKMFGIDLAKITEVQKSLDSTLPWDHIDVLISKKYLIREFKESMSS